MIGGFDVGRAVGAGLWDRHRALQFIGEFAAAWTRPLLPEDGYGEDVLRSVEEHLGVRLPAVLREAYLVLGKRADLTAVQDHLLALDRLRVDQAEAVIVFRRENQGCAEWGVAASDPRDPQDPPVFVRRPGDRPWEPFATRMSLACAEMVLSESLLGAEFMAMCDLSGLPVAAAAESTYQRVALPEFPLWYDTAVTSRWFAAPGKLLRMDGRGGSCWLVAAGQTDSDLESICTAIPAEWERVRLSRCGYPAAAAPGFQAAAFATPEQMTCARSKRSALHPTAHSRRSARSRGRSRGRRDISACRPELRSLGARRISLATLTTFSTLTRRPQCLSSRRSPTSLSL
jgi:hypothetical protein